MAITCPACRSENADTAHFCAACGAPIGGHVPGTCPQNSNLRASPTETLQGVLLKELATGTTFAGRSQVIEELGHGGMGEVYRSVDRNLGRQVAIKVLPAATVPSGRRMAGRFSSASAERGLRQLPQCRAPFGAG
jgi:hypothetical protein